MIAAGKVVEPLADLYKVEVRELGAKLGIPHDMIWRHPFPGPGLGVRLLCSDGHVPDAAQLVAIAPAVDALAAEAGLQAAPLPIRSVGVKADLRSYEHPVLFHGQADWATLKQLAGRVFKTVGGLNRALWNLGDTMPQSFLPLAAGMSRERLDLLRECDHLVMAALRRHGLYDQVWQCPTVLVPLEIDGRGEELCIVRPIRSERAMTATAAELPAGLLAELRRDILALPAIGGLAYDLTSKPPGTIEWE
jgi:GMP synthase (glutamine-hydrolysing)